MRVVIECDGHDFHEKTKQQVEARNQRDRDLQHMGYHVVHFAGSEIHKDSRQCVMEVIRLINDFMEDDIYQHYEAL